MTFPTTQPRLTAHELWERVADLLRNDIAPTSFQTWVAPCRGLRFDGQTLVVAAPNAYARDWLADRVTDLIRQKLLGLLGQRVNVEFCVAGTPTVSEIKPPSLPEAWTLPPDLGEQAAAEVDLPPMRLHPQYTFANFIVGPNNEFAYSACLAVAQRPGEGAYNPLFIYGGVGLGKTHLLQAIAHALLPQGRRVYYISAEDFFNQFFYALRTHTMETFRKRFRELDVLLVDDVHFLIGKERLQEEFFHTFNTLYYDRRQIVFTADRPPAALATLEERLRSRFEWGLIVDIQPPDYETRLAILKAKAEVRGMHVPLEVLQFVARQVEGNIRTLEGALNRLWAYHELRGLPITREMAEAVLADLLPKRWRPDPERVLRAVSEEFQVPVDKMRSRLRAKNVLLARQVAMYLLREDLRLSYPQIGRFFGGKDHSTVMHACEKIALAYEEDEALRRRIQRIREALYT